MRDIFLCETFKCLPYAGGLYNQPADWVEEALWALSARDEFNSKMKEYHGRQ